MSSHQTPLRIEKQKSKKYLEKFKLEGNKYNSIKKENNKKKNSQIVLSSEKVFLIFFASPKLFSSHKETLPSLLRDFVLAVFEKNGDKDTAMINDNVLTNFTKKTYFKHFEFKRSQNKASTVNSTKQTNGHSKWMFLKNTGKNLKKDEIFDADLNEKEKKVDHYNKTATKKMTHPANCAIVLQVKYIKVGCSERVLIIFKNKSYEKCDKKEIL